MADVKKVLQVTGDQIDKALLPIARERYSGRYFQSDGMGGLKSVEGGVGDDGFLMVTFTRGAVQDGKTTVTSDTSYQLIDEAMTMKRPVFGQIKDKALIHVFVASSSGGPRWIRFTRVNDEGTGLEMISLPKTSNVGTLEAIPLSGGYVTPEMFGAKGDGVADDSDAFEACASYCALNNLELATPEKSRYKFSRPVTVNALRRINIRGLIDGDLVLSMQNQKPSWYVPYVYIGYCHGTLTIKGAISADITVQRATELKLVADDTEGNLAIGYTKFWLGNIETLTIIGTGPDNWINENQFYGGRFKSVTSNGPEGFAFANNLFVKPMCEGTVVDFQIGEGNYIFDARFEDKTSSVTFGPLAYENVITTNYNNTEKGAFLTDDFPDHTDVKLLEDVTGTNALRRNDKLNVYPVTTICAANNPKNLPVVNGNIQVKGWQHIFDGELARIPDKTFCVLADFSALEFYWTISCYDEDRVQIKDPKILRSSPTVAVTSQGEIGNQSFNRLNYWAILDPKLDPRVKYISLSTQNYTTLTEIEHVTFRITSYANIRDYFIRTLGAEGKSG